ncbi:M16 family metallopeptidase [Candidatus Desulfovibrio trichonymphae]|uniref:Zn-dependent M16 family peptidase n=1 Tax=Candidatus Desulfovibrio trichonymphae TaxID=1725232 RepID=A0A1J1DVR9_9BACT|nr:pitrilysin family protein [Candidatus Desulfovibrio trichonymphae]BAV91956.1 Zn-dependent M16 family peptidase [Candidatus Desulfovibrio trichonymphae]
MRCLLFVPVLLLVIAVSSCGSAGLAFAGEGRLTRLPNGLGVYIIKDTRFPLVCVRLYVGTGSVNETRRQAGISHALEHMVFKGTDHRPKGQAAREVEALGGYLNATTGFDKTTYITDMPAAHWRTGLDVVKDMAFQAKLDAKDLETEKNVIISELEIGEDSPMRRLFEELQTAGLHNTAYGRPIIGYRDTVRAFSAEDLRSYVKRWYQPQNMLLLVAGDIDEDAVHAYAAKLFGGLKNSEALPAVATPDLCNAAGGPRVEVHRGPWSKVYLGISFPVPGLRDLRSVDLDVLSYLLGGDGTSFLRNKYKYDKHLVDEISVHNMSMAHVGLLTITATMDADKAAFFWQEFIRDMAKLRAKDFSAASLQRAKFNLEDEMDRAGETLNGLASWRGAVQFDLGGLEAERNLRFSQRTVDENRLQRAISDWLVPQRARVRVLAPQNAALPDFEAQLQQNWPGAGNVSAVATGQSHAGQRETLDLGMGRTLVLIPDATVPYISLELMMPGGNALISPEEQGLAELTARALTTGCAGFNAKGIERYFSERAASVDARAGLQTFGVSLTGHSRFNADYFTILGDMMRKPRFEKNEVRREAEDMKSAIRQRADRPLAYLFAKVNPFLFPGGHVYGFDGLGTPAGLDRFDGKNVREFWKRQSAQPWVLSVAGDFDRDDVLAFVKSLPEPAKISFRPDGEVLVTQPEWGNAHKLTLNLSGRNQAHLLRLFKAVPLSHPDAPALLLLREALSGQSGLLFSSLRDDQGLGYSVTAFYRAMPESGFMAFYIGTTADRMEQAKQGFAGVTAAVKTKPLPEKLLRAAYNQLVGDFYRQRQSLASRAGEAATDAVLHNPRDFQKTLIANAAKLTPADVQAAARKYLNDDDSYEVQLTP